MKHVAYYRVSTREQGLKGLGMEAQQESVAKFLATVAGANLIGSFHEVESGRRNDREELAKALELARKECARLVIARLDRLGRDAVFTLTLQRAGVDFVCCDNPYANKLTIGLLAIMAQNEAEMTSMRTKAALAALKARGVKLGTPRWDHSLPVARKAVQAHRRQFNERAMGIMSQIARAGVTQPAEVAECLNNRGEKTAAGRVWTEAAVERVAWRFHLPIAVNIQAD